jgi:hypothetical protein
VAPGTVCLDGSLVYPYDERCSASAGSGGGGAAVSASPSPSHVAATPVPTSMSCAGKADGFQCGPVTSGSCSSTFYFCSGGAASVLQAMAPGVACGPGGAILYANDAVCTGSSGGSGGSGGSPSPSPSATPAAADVNHPTCAGKADGVYCGNSVPSTSSCDTGDSIYYCVWGSATALQAVPAGTVCWHSELYWPADVPCLAGNFPGASASATATPSPLPTAGSGGGGGGGGGGVLSAVCAGKADGFAVCLSSPAQAAERAGLTPAQVSACTDAFTLCNGNGVASALLPVAPGTVCYGGELVWPTDTRCAVAGGGAASASTTPSRTPSPSPSKGASSGSGAAQLSCVGRADALYCVQSAAQAAHYAGMAAADVSPCTDNYAYCTGGVASVSMPVALGTACLDAGQGGYLVPVDAPQCGTGYFAGAGGTTPVAGATSSPSSAPAAGSASPSPSTGASVSATRTATATPSPTASPSKAPAVATGCETGNGIHCSPTDCGFAFYQCQAGVRYPDQETAPGTRCFNGSLVYDNDARCANDGRSCTAGQTAVKCWAGMGVATSNPCTSYYYSCSSGLAGAPQHVPTGTLCYGGALVTATSPVCAAPPSDSASSAAPVVLATVRLLVAGEDASSWDARAATTLQLAVADAVQQLPGAGLYGVTSPTVLVSAVGADASGTEAGARLLRARRLGAAHINVTGSAIAPGTLSSALASADASLEAGSTAVGGVVAVDVEVQLRVGNPAQAQSAAAALRALLSQAGRADVGFNDITRAAFAAAPAGWYVASDSSAGVQSTLLTAPTSWFPGDGGDATANAAGGVTCSTSATAAAALVAAVLTAAVLTEY